MERSVSRKTKWRKCLGAGYFGRLVDFNTSEVRPGRLLVQEGDFGYAVMGLGREAAAILRWLDQPGQGEALDQIGNNQAAGALYDTLFWSGATGGAERVREAINKVYATMGERPISEHGVLKQGAFDAYVSLAKDPANRQHLLKKLGDVRTVWAQKEDQYDKGRIEFFRSFEKK